MQRIGDDLRVGLTAGESGEERLGCCMGVGGGASIDASGAVGLRERFRSASWVALKRSREGRTSKLSDNGLSYWLRGTGDYADETILRRHQLRHDGPSQVGRLVSPACHLRGMGRMEKCLLVGSTWSRRRCSTWFNQGLLQSR